MTDKLRCQKCGEMGLPSPTVVLDLEAELEEERVTCALASATTARLVARHAALVGEIGRLTRYTLNIDAPSLDTVMMPKREGAYILIRDVEKLLSAAHPPT